MTDTFLIGFALRDDFWIYALVLAACVWLAFLILSFLDEMDKKDRFSKPIPSQEFIGPLPRISIWKRSICLFLTGIGMMLLLVVIWPGFAGGFLARTFKRVCNWQKRPSP